MLRLNGWKVEVGRFPDCTLLLKLKQGLCTQDSLLTIQWNYENDGELFALYSLTKHVQEQGRQVELVMPYIPNARMDRAKNPEDVFTLKYFADLINSLNFMRVEVLDPHSSVSGALLDRISIVKPTEFIQKTIKRINKSNLMMFYPDEGAMKRYSEMSTLPYAFGVKRRDWKSGKILDLEILGETGRIDGSHVLMVDDICSRGGTFMHSAEALKELGAKKIYLFVTHCEDTILAGKVLTSGLIEKVYTTDSICKLDHERIEVMNYGN